MKETNPSPNANPSGKFLILILLAAATALRLYKLGSGLWHDEVLTYFKYVKLPFSSIVTTFEDQNQHFLFTLLAHASILLFGDNNAALRLPAVLFGVASIWAIYRFGREVCTETESLLAAAL